MVLNFGPIGTRSSIQTADYRSAGSHQAENLNYEQIESQATYEEIVVVSTGKTYYVSSIILSTAAASAAINLATGAAASEVDFTEIVMGTNTVPVVFLNFGTPIKFQSGTRISGSTSDAVDAHITLIGWEE